MRGSVLVPGGVPGVFDSVLGVRGGVPDGVHGVPGVPDVCLAMCLVMCLVMCLRGTVEERLAGLETKHIAVAVVLKQDIELVIFYAHAISHWLYSCWDEDRGV